MLRRSITRGRAIYLMTCCIVVVSIFVTFKWRAKTRVHYTKNFPVGRKSVPSKGIDVKFLLSVRATPEHYHISDLIDFRGESTRSVQPFPDQISIVDYADSDSNAQIVDRALSSNSIPFVCIRDSSHGGFYPPGFLTIDVPKTRYQEALSILIAAANAGQLTINPYPDH